MMQVITNLDDVRLSGPSVLTIGTFDGLHRGHQDIIRQLKTAARALEAQTAVMAFHPRPKAVFAPHLFKNDYLTTAAERIALFEQIGIDALILIPFTLKLSQIAATDFVKLISRRFNLAQLCVGHDFALGKNREGTIARLAELGQTFNYTVREIETFRLDNTIVSSTQIRKHLLAGEARQATHLLGRYPSLTSRIVKGAQRGRAIGFPTANFTVPGERLLPGNGVYATFIRFPGRAQRYAGVTNVGVRPSFGGDGRTVEAHIFDFDQDIYGKAATLEFVERLRPEKKFESIDALTAQIARDADQARSLLAVEQQ